jgi:outer membrane lipoprotein-sorting protein
MRSVLLVLLLPAAAAAGGGNEAEKLFRQVEKKITSAKSLKVSATIEVQGKSDDGKVEATLVWAAGNKARLKFSGNIQGKDVTMEVVSDGKRMLSTGFGKSKEEKARKNLDDLLTRMVSRAGLLGIFFIVRQGGPGQPAGDPDSEKLFNARDFKLGEAEKVGGRDARVIRYRIIPEIGNPVAVTLWVDVKTLLPLKRQIAPEQKDADTITETTTTFTLNPKLDPKTFELPK